MWERETIIATEVAETASEKGCNRGVLLGLMRAWPLAVRCGHGRTEAEEDSSVTVGEGAGIAGAVEEEVAGGCDEESIKFHPSLV